MASETTRRAVPVRKSGPTPSSRFAAFTTTANSVLWAPPQTTFQTPHVPHNRILPASVVLWVALQTLIGCTCWQLYHCNHLLHHYSRCVPGITAQRLVNGICLCNCFCFLLFCFYEEECCAWFLLSGFMHLAGVTSITPSKPLYWRIETINFIVWRVFVAQTYPYQLIKFAILNELYAWLGS